MKDFHVQDTTFGLKASKVSLILNEW